MQNQVVAKRKKINKTLARVADNPNRCKIWQRDASLQNCVSTFLGQQGLWFPERKKLLNFPIVPWLCGPLKVNICKGLSAAAMSSVVLHVDITYASYFQKEPSVYWRGSFITLKILYYGSKCNYKVVLSLAVVEVAGKQVHWLVSHSAETLYWPNLTHSNLGVTALQRPEPKPVIIFDAIFSRMQLMQIYLLI